MAQASRPIDPFAATVSCGYTSRDCRGGSCARHDSASSSAAASNHVWTRAPDRPAPRLEREEAMEVPQRERLNGKVQKRGAASKVGERRGSGSAHAWRPARAVRPADMLCCSAARRGEVKRCESMCSKMLAYCASVRSPVPASSKTRVTAWAVANDSDDPGEQRDTPEAVRHHAAEVQRRRRSTATRRSRRPRP